MPSELALVGTNLAADRYHLDKKREDCPVLSGDSPRRPNPAILKLSSPIRHCRSALTILGFTSLRSRVSRVRDAGVQDDAIAWLECFTKSPTCSTAPAGLVADHLSQGCRQSDPRILANSRNLLIIYRLRRDKLDGWISDGF